MNDRLIGIALAVVFLSFPSVAVVNAYQDPPKTATTSSEKASESKQGRVLQGTVTDESGMPIANAQVGISSASVSTLELRDMTTRTDKDGKWKWKWDLSGELGIAGLSISHPEFLTLRFALDESANEYSHQLKPAFVIRGQIVGLNGNAAKDVLVTATMVNEEIFFQGRPTWTTYSDEKGNFELRGMQRPVVHLRALDKEGNYDWQNNLRCDNTIHRLDLMAPGRPLQFEVVDANNQPVGGAKISVGDWKRCGIYSWFGQTDQEGQVTWASPPKEDIAMIVQKEGFRFAWHFVDHSRDIQRVKLYSPQVIHGTVLDADTGEPIPSFQVGATFQRKVKRLTPFESFPDGSGMPGPRGTQRFPAEKIEGKDGSFSLINDLDFESVQLLIENEDYERVTVSRIDSDLVEKQLEVRLKKRTFEKGIVLLPNGQAPQHATVAFGMGIAFWSQSIPYLRSLENNPYGTFFSATEPDGSFRERWQKETGAGHISVWSEEGWYDGTKISYEKEHKIVLQPWRKLRISGFGKLPIHQKLGLMLKQVLEDRSIYVGIPVQVEGEQLVLDRVRPGKFQLYQEMHHSNMSVPLPLATFTVSEEEEETFVEVSGSSHAMGRIELEGIKRGTPLDHAKKYVRIVPSEKQEETTLAYIYPLDQQGNFRFENIAAGDYRLEVLAFAGKTSFPQVEGEFKFNFASAGTFLLELGETKDLDVIHVKATATRAR